jgi:hypothetical protein
MVDLHGPGRHPERWAIAGANRHDMILLGPTLKDVADRGVTKDVATLHLDRGYANESARVLVASSGADDLVCAQSRKRGHRGDTAALAPRDAVARRAH